MEQYFKEFEEKLQVTEEKLDILSEWHIAKEHNGTAEIAEECELRSLYSITKQIL